MDKKLKVETITDSLWVWYSKALEPSIGSSSIRVDNQSDYIEIFWKDSSSVDGEYHCIFREGELSFIHFSLVASSQDERESKTMQMIIDEIVPRTQEDNFGLIVMTIDKLTSQMSLIIRPGLVVGALEFNETVKAKLIEDMLSKMSSKILGAMLNA